MRLSNVIGGQSLLWLGIALMLTFAPVYFLTFFGAASTPFETVVARLFGAELTGLALVSWFTRSVTSVFKGLAISYFICNALGFVVSLTATMSGKLNSFGWIIVVLYFLYALAFAYFSIATNQETRN